MFFYPILEYFLVELANLDVTLLQSLITFFLINQIGNGNGMEDGQIDSDIRKKYNLWGVHVSGQNFDKNIRGLGICIVGNLDKKKMSLKQYESLLRLTKELMDAYSIKIEDVVFHGKIFGESTKCPGKFFPYNKFEKDIKRKISTL